MRTKVKICGITNLKDALHASACGADALGFIFWEGSKRHITVDKAAEVIRGLPPLLTKVGVFVDESAETINGIIRETGINAAQLHGDEDPDVCGAIDGEVIKVIRVSTHKDIEDIERYDVSAFLLDTFKEGTPGGTGEIFDWDIAVDAKRKGPIILSGGLDMSNVSKAVKSVLPYAVDVCSGVEKDKGVKDPLKVFNFLEEVKRL